MSDYQNEKRGDRIAHKYRWLVWLFWPAFLALIFFADTIIGAHWWSFGK